MIRKLAGNCFFVKGYKMNLLFDIQNSVWYHIKESEEELIGNNLNIEMKEYLELNGIVLDIPDFMIDSLPQIDTSYKSPQIYEGIIIDISKKTSFHIPTILKKLDYLNLVNLQLRFFDSPEIGYLQEIIDSLDILTIESSEIILPYSIDTLDVLEKDDYILKASKVFKVIFHSINLNSIFKKSNINKIYFTSDYILDDSYCGQISALNFSSNPKHLFKSINYNSCLHKKIGIDVDGNIKNCPSLKFVIGNIEDLDSINITGNEFKTSFIKKDDIEVCKDCEFRHICTDCRAFTDSSSRTNSRPMKCGYNPYIGKWSHENDYLPLSKCGIHSNENEFSIDHDKIAKINKKIWGEGD